MYKGYNWGDIRKGRPRIVFKEQIKEKVKVCKVLKGQGGYSVQSRNI